MEVIMRAPSLPAIALCLLPALAAAQTPVEPSRPEILGTVSLSNLWDDESSLGTGLTGGAGVGYRWRGRVGVEGRVEWFSHERTFLSAVRFHAEGTRVLGQVAYYWLNGKAQPFAAGTVGVIRVNQTNESPIFAPGPEGLPNRIGTNVVSGRATDFAWGGSSGVRNRLTDRLALRPEAGILLSVPHNFVDIRFGVTAAVSW
jgi:hypothetical protein